MKNEKLLADLNTMKQNNNKESYYLNNEILNSLIESVKQDILLSNVSSPSKKKSLNKALSFLKKQKTRPIFSFANKQTIGYEDYYCFTDSYIVFYLKENNGLPLYEDLTEEEMRNNNSLPSSYPKLDKLVPSVSNCQEVNIIDYKDCVNLIKANKVGKEDVILSIKSNDLACYINSKFLKLAYEILNTDTLKCYVYKRFSPVLFENENGDKAIICQLKLTPEIEKNALDVCKNV